MLFFTLWGHPRGVVTLFDLILKLKNNTQYTYKILFMILENSELPDFDIWRRRETCGLRVVRAVLPNDPIQRLNEANLATHVVMMIMSILNLSPKIYKITIHISHV